MSLFTEAELRVLKYGDRACNGPGRGGNSGPRSPGMLGSLREAEARQLVAEGRTNIEIAELAGVLPRRVTDWKCARGISRRKRTDGAT